MFLYGSGCSPTKLFSKDLFNVLNKNINICSVHKSKIMKEEFKTILAEFEKSELPKLVRREYTLPPHDLVAVVGPRRAGKTYFLFQQIAELGKENCLFMNFERGALAGISAREFGDMLMAYKELYGKEPKYIMLDEIQVVKDWEIGVRELHDKRKYNIVITGSSSKLLPREIATQLRGRVVSILLLPFSFREFLRARGVEIDEFSIYAEKATILKNLDDYLQNGGFPEPTLKPEIYEELMASLRDGIFYRDIVERFRIRKVKTFEFFTKLLVSYFSSYYTYSKLVNILASSGAKVSKNTLIEFTKMLEECLLVFSVERFQPKIKEILRAPKKVYVVDTGLIKFFAPKFSKDVGRLMENCVFLELKRRGRGEIFYFKANDKEVDFVVKEGLRIKQLIQVTYASGKDEIERREIKSLIKASELLKCNDLLMITWDYEDELKVRNRLIKCLPLWKWLLAD